MIKFEYSYPDYELLLEALAKKVNVRLKDGWLFFPQEFGNGYIRYVRLPNGLNVNIINCTSKTNLFFQRSKSEDEYYTLRFHNITIAGKMKVGLGEDVIERSNQKLSIAYLTSSLNDWYYHFSPGTNIQGISILISKAELGKQLGIDMVEKILPAYILLKSRSVTMEPLDTYYLQLMDEILVEDPDTPYTKLYVMNRVQLLVERFFSRIRSRVEIADVESNFKSDDIHAIMEVEKIMLKDFTKKPPSINELCRKAAMSATKFKNLFKAVYGVPVYEYYQQKRMHEAATLIDGGGSSIKELAAKVGYSNTSNFAAAFKKQFSMLPNEYKTG